MSPVELLGQGAAVAVEHRASAGLKQITTVRGEMVSAQQEHRAPRVMASERWHQFVHAHQ